MKYTKGSKSRNLSTTLVVGFRVNSYKQKIMNPNSINLCCIRYIGNIATTARSRIISIINILLAGYPNHAPHLPNARDNPTANKIHFEEKSNLTTIVCYQHEEQHVWPSKT